MKAFRRLISAAALISLLAACQERLPEPDSPVIGEEGVPLELEVIANPASVTRGPIYDTFLPEGARIGVAIVENGLDTYDGKNLMNIPYEAKTKDGEQVWEAVTDPILLTHTTGNVYAYYPYSEDITSLREIPLKASSTHQVDYLHAKKVSSKRKNDPKASIYFYHILGVVRLSITRGTYTGEGVITSASVGGECIAGKAMLNTIDARVTDYEDIGVHIGPPIEPLTISSEKQWRDIIVVPTGTDAKLEIELCIDGRKVMVETSRNTTISGGYINNINITIDKGSAYVTSTDVTEWTHDKFSNRIDLKEHTVTFAGNTEALTFDSSVDEEGNVNIIVAPQFTIDSEVKPVTIDGEATLEQNVDEETGIMTIKLSDINSDVTINFNGFWLWMTFVHEITDISQPTRIYYGGSPERIKMDGVEISTEMYHQFETTGEHVMKMAIKNYKGYQYSFMQYILTVKSAIFPEGMETLGAWCFLGCSNLKEVSLPSTLKSISYQVFERSGLTSCVVPDGCRMSYGVFDECRSLTYVKLPSDMTAIPDGTLAGCSSLADFEIPTGVTSIGHSAFEGTAITSIAFPDAVSELADEVCRSCKYLKEIRLPANLKKIGRQAFSFCESIERFIQADGSYEEGVFTIPEGVTEIGEIPFYFRSPTIKTMSIPSTLTTVVDRSFSCPNLERYIIPNGNPVFDIRNNSVVETATNRLIAGAILSSKIHESVTTIGKEAFYESCIASVDLHAGITKIEDYAFDYSDITQIICRATIPPTLGESPFRLTNYSGRMKVPEESISLYRSTWYLTDVGYLGWTNYRWGLVALAEGE